MAAGVSLLESAPPEYLSVRGEQWALGNSFANVGDRSGHLITDPGDLFRLLFEIGGGQPLVLERLE